MLQFLQYLWRNNAGVSIKDTSFKIFLTPNQITLIAFAHIKGDIAVYDDTLSL